MMRVEQAVLRVLIRRERRMDSDLSQFVPQVGTDVIGADGEKVGEIDAVERDYFIVRKGFFFPQDHYIPMTAVSSYDEDKIYLNVTKDEALEQEWTNPPIEGRTIDVPVTEEEIHGTRRVVDRDAAFEEGTIEVPLRGEEVDAESYTDPASGEGPEIPPDRNRWHV
jgi:hypothetical protein